MDYDDYNVKDHISFINFEYLASAELKAGAYRDWGLFYKHRNLYQLAVDSFSASLDHDATSYQALLERTLCHLALGDANAALASIERCIDLRDRPIAQLHRNTCVYEQNRFEAALTLYSTSAQQYPRCSAQRHGADMVRLTIEHTVDQRLVGNCLLNMRADIAKYDQHRLANLDQPADDGEGVQPQRQRPLWKVLRERGECDVVSVLIRPAPYVPLIHLLRTERKRSTKDMRYLGRQTALDIAFLMGLQHDRRLHLKHTVASNATISAAIEQGLRGVLSMERRLWSRKPLYTMRKAQQPTGGRSTDVAEQGLYRIQYQTRREVFAQLAEIQRLADAGQLDRVRARVDHVIANYYSTKTRRVFPRKFEFLNEVINEVALVYLRQCVLMPEHLMELEPADSRLPALLQMLGDRKADEATSAMATKTKKRRRKADGVDDGSPEFGDKSAFVDPGEPDVAYYTYKRRVNELELRLQRCSYPIERCHLCYELVMSHMGERKPDETRLQAGRLVTHAIECGNRVWEFVGLLLGARVEVGVGQLQAAGQRLQRMAELAPIFDKTVQRFVNVAQMLHGEQLGARERQKQQHFKQPTQ